ncbi:MAG: PspC domain-containing protein [Bacteroidota bacterium]|nr:PspC domain-containing protein [Bacteroidota bacterium]
MKKVININFQGTVVPIEESSYELLKQYIESLRRYFANEEGKDEIINDIESRISELFQERLKNGSTCITDDDVNAIIKNMGRPADFEEQEKEEGDHSKKEQSDKTETIFNANFSWKGKRLYRDENHKILGGVCGGIASYFGIDPVIVRVVFILSGIGFLAYILLWIFVPGSNMLENGARKRLYRNPDGKIIGGICSGMGSYFNINPWIPRAIFLIPFISFFFRWGHFGPLTFPNFISFSFSPGTFIIYIILWLVIPEATTTSEKLEMKGEKVDLNSIKNSVLKEMKEVGVRVGKMGSQAGEMAKNRSAEMGQEIHMAARRSSGTLGNIITTLFKIFIYFILGCIALALIIALFSLAIVSIGLFPLKNFVLSEGWQSILAWGTLIFFIGVPVIGIITFIIRRIARIKTTNKLMRYSFISLWILGIICFVSLITSVGRDFKSISSMNPANVMLTNAAVKSLEVMPIQNSNYYRSNSWFRLEPFATFGMDDDTAYISNVKIKIEKSNIDSFKVSVIKMVNGRTRRYADTLASLIDFNISQSDSLLMMDKAITINTADKFRNQFVEVIIAVPVGHYIKINKNFGYRNRVRFTGPWSDNDWYNNESDEDYDFKIGEEYVMKEDGLYTLKGIPSNKEDDWNAQNENENNTSPNVNDTNYRYNNGSKIDSLKAIQEKQILQMQASVDSLKIAREKELNRMKDSLRKAKDEIDRKIEKLNKGTALNQDAPIKDVHESYSFIMYI